MAPNWISTAKVLPKSSSAKPKKRCTSSRCPVEDTGMNSVRPSTIPRMMALMMSKVMKCSSGRDEGDGASAVLFAQPPLGSNAARGVAQQNARSGEAVEIDGDFGLGLG